MLAHAKRGDLEDTAFAESLQRCISLVDEAKNAEWKNDVGQILPFPGSDTDDRGFARVLSSARLEDGGVYSNVLETHPRWEDHGLIYGVFKVKLPLGAKYFRAKVGFLRGATGTDGVEFRFYINNILYELLYDTYDGVLKEIEVDVSGYAGQEVEIILQVYAGASSGQDWAVWVDPAIWCYPPSIAISASPNTATVEQGGQAVYQVSISSSYVEEVSLSLAGYPSGSEYSFTPSSGTEDFTSVLVVQTTADTPPGTYHLTIEASGDGITSSKTVKLVVKAAGAFELELEPSSLTIPQGGTAHSMVSVIPIGGFNQPVSLSLEEVPEGVSATLGSSLVNPGETTDLTIEISLDKEPGSYALKVKGTYEDKTYTAVLSIEVVATGFALALSPDYISLNQGESGTIRVTVEPTGGFSETVSLALLDAPPGVSGSFDPPEVAPGSSSTLTLVVGSDAPPGDYVLTVRGTGGGREASATLTLRVLEVAFDFSLSVSPSSLEIKQGEVTTVVVAVDKISGEGEVSLSLEGLPPGASYTFDPPIVTPPGVSMLTIDTGSAKGSYTLVIKGTGDGVEKVAILALNIREQRCVIATATYGSEVSEEVQFLRDFRDSVVLSTYAGRSFYRAFNAFYYSWSPAVAQLIAEHGWLKALMRILLYPLIAILALASAVATALIGISPEIGVYVAGSIASSLIGVVYATPAVLAVAELVGKRPSLRFSKLLALATLATLASCAIVQAVALDWMLALATFLYVALLLLTSGYAVVALLLSLKPASKIRSPS